MSLIVIALQSVGIKPDRASIDQPDTLLGKYHLLFQLAWQPDVILIEEGNPLSSGLPNRVAACLAKRNIRRRKKIANPLVMVIGNDGALASVEQSSQTMSSHSVNVCAKSLSMASRRVVAPLRTFMTMLTNGIGRCAANPAKLRVLTKPDETRPARNRAGPARTPDLRPLDRNTAKSGQS